MHVLYDFLLCIFVEWRTKGSLAIFFPSLRRSKCVSLKLRKLNYWMLWEELYSKQILLGSQYSPSNSCGAWTGSVPIRSVESKANRALNTPSAEKMRTSFQEGTRGFLSMCQWPDPGPGGCSVYLPLTFPYSPDKPLCSSLSTWSPTPS